MKDQTKQKKKAGTQGRSSIFERNDNLKKGSWGLSELHKPIKDQMDKEKGDG